MLCHRARRRLNECDWFQGNYSLDEELMEHLGKCPKCYSLVQAEETLRSDLGVLQEAKPDGDLSLNAIREKAEGLARGANRVEQDVRSFAHRMALALVPNTRYKFAVVAIAILVGFLAIVPFNFNEKIGYEIAIGGVEKSIALDNQQITSLLGALGMEKGKASILLDSLGMSDIRLSVGECSETCRLTISDLKTERDVRLMVKAIIELGCCQIDKIAPIFRSESTSLLRLAARKLLS
ncbi:MAG: hypothetical protein NT028_10150 [candidate division Zixibacteria bacterium]|nr:hypothetical protein [candidate division Zixibacteria bacterium]